MLDKVAKPKITSYLYVVFEVPIFFSKSAILIFQNSICVLNALTAK